MLWRVLLRGEPSSALTQQAGVGSAVSPRRPATSHLVMGNGTQEVKQPVSPALGDELSVPNGCQRRLCNSRAQLWENSYLLDCRRHPPGTHPPSTSRPSEDTAMEKTAKRRSSGLERANKEWGYMAFPSTQTLARTVRHSLVLSACQNVDHLRENLAISSTLLLWLAGWVLPAQGPAAPCFPL